jgi:metallopeptidase MepB
VDGSRHHPVAALLCAFTRPSATKPSLLSHHNAVIMFHELGHAIHDIVSKTQYSRFSGAAGVNVDFGELPSQLLEQWCWSPSQLKALSFHYSHLSPEMLEIWKKENEGNAQPEKHMSDELIEAFIGARKLSFGPLYYLEQLYRAIFDMTIYQPSSLEEVQSLDLAAIWNKVVKQTMQMDGPEILGGYSTFGHLFSTDYSAGYYSYL